MGLFPVETDLPNTPRGLIGIVPFHVNRKPELKASLLPAPIVATPVTLQEGLRRLGDLGPVESLLLAFDYLEGTDARLVPRGGEHHEVGPTIAV
jgi:hypothetical protein